MKDLPRNIPLMFQIHTLFNEGLTITEIAKKLNIRKITVKKYQKYHDFFVVNELYVQQIRKLLTSDKLATQDKIALESFLRFFYVYKQVVEHFSQTPMEL